MPLNTPGKVMWVDVVAISGARFDHLIGGVLDSNAVVAAD
jgi:hypothetical protein